MSKWKAENLPRPSLLARQFRQDPQLNALDIRRRALLAAGVLLAFDITACGGGGGGNGGDSPPASVSSGGVVTTLAGSGLVGGADGTALVASFNNPTGISVDITGNVYVADLGSGLIRKISSAGVVTIPSFGLPLIDVAVDINGNIYSTTWVKFSCGDSGYLVGKTTSAGVVSTVQYVTSACTAGGSGGNGTGAGDSYFPYAMAMDASGDMYLAEFDKQVISKITSTGQWGLLLAGSGSAGSANGTGTVASFNGPRGVAVDANGNVYVADTNNHMIRMITSAGVVTTLAGSGAQGSTNDTGTAASFNFPKGVAVDNSGNVYVADTSNHLIRKITSAGVVTTLAGSGVQGATNGARSVASFSNPAGIAVDANGVVYVADSGNNMIRKIS